MEGGGGVAGEGGYDWTSGQLVRGLDGHWTRGVDRVLQARTGVILAKIKDNVTWGVGSERRHGLC
jgi:hypothetical protein